MFSAAPVGQDPRPETTKAYGTTAPCPVKGLLWSADGGPVLGRGGMYIFRDLKHNHKLLLAFLTHFILFRFLINNLHTSALSTMLIMKLRNKDCQLEY